MTQDVEMLVKMISFNSVDTFFAKNFLQKLVNMNRVMFLKNKSSVPFVRTNYAKGREACNLAK